MHDTLEAAQEEIKRLVRACVQQQFEIEQTLGKALGYPLAGPEIGGDGKTVECGEHIAETLAIEAAEEIERLREALSPFAAYVDLRGDAMPDSTPMDDVLPRGPTLGDCRRAKQLLPAPEVSRCSLS